MQNLKILMICGSLYPAQTGGVDNAVYWYAKGLVRKGVDVKIITTDSGLAQNIERNKELDTNFGQVKYVRKKGFFPFLWIIKCFIAIFTEKRLIHFHSITYSSPFLFILPFLRKKVIWSVHGELDDYAVENGKVRLKKIIRFLYRLQYKKIIFHSTCLKETQSIKSLIHKNANIFEVTILMELPKQESKEASSKYFSFIGRIDRKKAIENLIKALGKSKKFKTSNFSLKIAGNYKNDYGKEMIQLCQKLLIKDKIHFIGHISGVEKNKFLAKSYANFMPSHAENFGIVTLEALAQGTPAIASKGTPWENLNHKNAGFWVDNSIDSLKNIIEEIIVLDNKQYINLSKNAYLIAKEFNVFIKIKNLIQVYQSIR